MRSYSKFSILALLICLFCILLSGCAQKLADNTSSSDSVATSDSSDSVSSGDSDSSGASLNDPGYTPDIDEVYPPYEGNEELYKTYPIVWLTYKGEEIEIREDREKAVALDRMINMNEAVYEDYREPPEDRIVMRVQDGEGTSHTWSVWLEGDKTILGYGANSEQAYGYKGDDGKIGYAPLLVFEGTERFDMLLEAMG